MQTQWLVLVPPFAVLICAFITRKLNIALILGILVGALIATNFWLPATLNLAFSRFLQTITTIDNLYMYSFLIILSIMIALINHTGGASAFAHRITARLRSGRAAQTSSMLLSCTLFIDDYLSGLTVGHVMRPIMDKFHIPRAKLAFLVHSMTTPLVILAPISSWVAMIINTFEDAGINPTQSATAKIIGDPFYIYINAIPYIFYSFLIIGSVWFIVQFGISYGPMHEQERIAQKTGNLFGGKAPLKERFAQVSEQHSSISDLLLPLGVLIASVFAGCLWAGNFWLFGGTRGLFDAFKHNTKISFVLFCSSIIALCTSLVFAFLRKKIRLSSCPWITRDGIALMYNAVIMVILASTLGSILRLDLQTGSYLASMLHGSLSITLLPAIFFIVSALSATLTGSSWSTMMLLIPIAIPMITSLTHSDGALTPDLTALLYPVLGAIFSGAVCGDHLSPISETTIMASTSSGAYPVDHAQTQFFYAIPAIICSIMAFVLAGIFINFTGITKIALCLVPSFILCLFMLYCLNKVFKHQK